MRPVDVTSENQHIAFRNIYGVDTLRDLLRLKSKEKLLNKEDTVRLPYIAGPLEKGYYPKWTDETDIVKDVIISGSRPLYRLANRKRRYYKDELQQVSKNPKFRIEKVIKSRSRNGTREYYVKWLNHPASYNSWINASDVTLVGV
ncbi:hypothetical protein HDE_13276 [Halotydeus destructor]|nr:hypothetical protein HDE_13276 [Halotydeus destructor]